MLTVPVNSRGYAQNDRGSFRLNSYLLSFSVRYAIREGS